MSKPTDNSMAKLRYRVTPLRDDKGNVSPHFLTGELQAAGITWDQAMDDPLFAQIIAQELMAEQVAHAPLDHLAAYAPSTRVENLYRTWLRYIDRTLNPWTTGGAIHFRPHWARVLMIALSLGDEAGLSDADLRALAMAAVFHDSRRKNPYLDTGHGLRASSYYEAAARTETGMRSDSEPQGAGESQGASKSQGAAESSDCPLVFDPRTLLTIRWHDRDDADGLAAFDRAQDLLELAPAGAQADVASIYRLFKDADGLDRVRLGPNQLDTHFLRTQAAIKSVDFARELLEVSSKSPFDN